MRRAMNEALERHADQPWYEDAVDAEFDPDLSDIDRSFERGLPLYFSDPSDGNLKRAREAMLPIEMNTDPLLWFYEREWGGLDLRPLIPRIICPLLAIVGEHDWAVPPIQAAFYRSAPRDMVVEIADCGHFVPLEAPGAYRQAVADWVSAGGFGGDLPDPL